MSSDGAQRPTPGRVGLAELFNLITSGNNDADVAEALAWQLVELNKQLLSEERVRLTAIAGGRELGEIARGIIEALDPKRQNAVAAASRKLGTSAGRMSVAASGQMMLYAALRPIRSNPQWREAVLGMRRRRLAPD